MVIPSLKGIPSVIERDSSTADAVRELIEARIITPETTGNSAQEIVESAIEGLFGPVLRKLNDNFDIIYVTRHRSEPCAALPKTTWRVWCYDCALHECISLKPIFDAISDPELRRWVGWVLNNHRKLSPPRNWLDWLDELRADGENQNGEEVPGTPPDDIDKEKAKLRSLHPHLVAPDEKPCMLHVEARRRMANVDQELADILYALAVGTETEDMTGGNEPLMCCVYEQGDIVSHAIERINHLISEGFYDQSSNALCDFCETLDRLVPRLDAIDQWLSPIDRLHTWTCK